MRRRPARRSGARVDDSGPDRGIAAGSSPRRRAGLTLVEVVIATLLLTALTLGTSMVLVPLARQSRINRETTTANAQARRVIERILALPFRDIVTAYPDGTTLDLEDLQGGTLTVSYADPLANPLEIRLELEWKSSDAGAMAVSFVTARTD